MKKLDKLIEKTKKAQQEYAKFSQEQVDFIFKKAAMAAAAKRIELAKDAVAETAMGVVEDKVIKNHFAAEYVYNKYKDVQTCGELCNDHSFGFKQIAEPLGIIAGVIPTTNPTSTAIFKSLLALKTRNGAIFSPHPRAKECTAKAIKIIYDAAVEAGAPEGILACLEEPSIEETNYLMSHTDINLILATGGPGMVKAAYSSGTPAIGVGAGNTPVIIDETADVRMAVNSIIMSKTFDNGVICASEQSIVVVDSMYKAVKKEFIARGCAFITGKDKDKLAKTIIVDGHVNSKIVGQSAEKIAELAKIKVPAGTKILIAEAKSVGEKEPFSYEKLSPVLGFYKASDFEDAVDLAKSLVSFGGAGHTSVLYTDEANSSERIDYFASNMITGRTLINMPSSQGAIGDVYNFKLAPSLTLGCGSWGGNSVSENIGVKHLLNIKSVAERRENMLWYRVPNKVYFKSGAIQLALEELKGKKRAFIITDKVLEDLGYTKSIIETLEKVGISFRVFSSVKPDPDTDTVHSALSEINSFEPDVIIALGGGSPIDAAKMMWLLYEYPEQNFDDIAMRFMDIRKRICEFPKLGKKAVFVAIPTTSGTGSEVTPFTVITDSKTGQKYPIADYELTPNMAIIDPEMVMNMPKSLCAAGGIDALVHSIEAFTSILASNFSDGQALEAIRLIFKYLPSSYKDGAKNPMAREKMHYASTMAGMAFANAFLGVCHSMAHKLGAKFHIPHGIANAMLISYVVEYNATNAPTKQGLLPQYKYPFVKGRYAKIVDSLHLADDLDDSDKSRDKKVKILINKIEELKAELEIPSSLKEMGINEKDFLDAVDEMSEDAFDDQCTGGNARYPLIKEIKELYLKAYYGK